MYVRPAIDRKALADFCQRYHLRRLALFGSVLREDFSEESDIDVLVEFSAGFVPGLIALAQMEQALTEILGRKADIRTAAELSPYFRDEVLREAQDQYVA